MFRVEVYDNGEWRGVVGMLFANQDDARDKARELFNTMPGLREHGVRVGESGVGVVWGIGVRQSYTLFVMLRGVRVRRKTSANVAYTVAEDSRQKLSDVYPFAQIIADNYPIESGVASLTSQARVLELRVSPLASVKG